MPGSRTGRRSRSSSLKAERGQIAVIGDGAVGLLAILAAKQLGAERIIAFSRHADRQELAREFGATDIVQERGDDGVAKVKELTGALGAHSVIEAMIVRIWRSLSASHAAMPSTAPWLI